ncbi:hypothetical protein PAHAL_1G082900 [Panicum hallii]|uniref:Uncharacterized protein n=1 Tax=Panicum hallii TaxID=206008 RepID=A0A2T8KUF5_9POAL|nr:hypothetical protein PAHAL_1G082900 [Panicum hallii]
MDQAMTPCISKPYVFCFLRIIHVHTNSLTLVRAWKLYCTNTALSTFQQTYFVQNKKGKKDRRHQTDVITQAASSSLWARRSAQFILVS